MRSQESREHCTPKPPGGRKHGPCRVSHQPGNKSAVMKVERQEIKEVVVEHEDVFAGIGKLKGVTVRLHVVPNSPGAVQRQRRVSIK